MNPEELLDQARALLATHGWKYENERYYHKSGLQIPASHPERSTYGILSPTSITSTDRCRRRLFLYKKKENKEAYFVNINGDCGKQLIIPSINGFEGTIYHACLFHTVENIKACKSAPISLKWRVAIAPAIHLAIVENCEPLTSGPSQTRQLLGDIAIRTDSMESVITAVAKELWSKRIGGAFFDKTGLASQLNGLMLYPEMELERDGLSGVSDLVAETKDGAWVVDYKTGRLPTIDQSSFAQDEFVRIINSPDHELYTYALQIASYAWMLSKTCTVTKALLVYTSACPIHIKEFVVGDKVLDSIEQRVLSSLDVVKEVIAQASPPPGKFNTTSCAACPFKMNCSDLKAQCQEQLPGWMEARRPHYYPVLLDVVEVSPSSNTIIVKVNSEKLTVKISNKYTNYLSLANSVQRSGHGLLAHMLLSKSHDGLFGNEIEFSRGA
jgi:CRISPR/Cas system-associated exonuclease Cas4 (RecB family)